jgi:hypothetical protein
MRRLVRAYVAFADRASGSLNESAWSGKSRRAKWGWAAVLAGIVVTVIVLFGLGLQHRGRDAPDIWVPLLLALAWVFPMAVMIPFGLRRAMRFLILSTPAYLLAFVFLSWLSFRLWG